MTVDQWIITATLLAAFTAFLIDKIRYDIVALIALLVLVVAGIIEPVESFRGFAHPAVVLVATMLALSHAIEASGVIGAITRRILPRELSMFKACLILTGLVGILSGFMNNVGALALFIPVTVRLAAANGISPSLLLMPLAFGSILGGLTTQLGTPPNIIIAEFRREQLGEPFGLFDYTAVGVIVATAGILVVTVLAKKLVPSRVKEDAPGSALDALEPYVMELKVHDSSWVCGDDLDGLKNRCPEGVTVLAIMRGNDVIDEDDCGALEPGDVLRVSGDLESLKEAIVECGLYVATEDEFGENPIYGIASATREVIVLPQSDSIGKCPADLDLFGSHALAALAISRQKGDITKPIADTDLEEGDVILLHTKGEDCTQSFFDLQWAPLENRTHGPSYKLSLLPAEFFIAAIICAALKFAPVHICLVIALLATILTNRITLDDLYRKIDWPIIVLLGALIPIGQTLQSSGLSEIITGVLSTVLTGLPVYAVVAFLIAMSMALSNIVNNSATAILFAPLALDLAGVLDINPDTLLMAAAVGASCCFLTPIGHQSNLLVMTPGAYKFSDYWKLGLPVSLAVLVAGTASVLLIWPG